MNIFWKERFLAACVMLIDGQVTCQAKIYNPLFALPLKKSRSEVKVYTSPVVEGRLSVHSFAADHRSDILGMRAVVLF